MGAHARLYCCARKHARHVLIDASAALGRMPTDGHSVCFATTVLHICLDRSLGICAFDFVTIRGHLSSGSCDYLIFPRTPGATGLRLRHRQGLPKAYRRPHRRLKGQHGQDARRLRCQQGGRSFRHPGREQRCRWWWRNFFVSRSKDGAKQESQALSSCDFRALDTTHEEMMLLLLRRWGLKARSSLFDVVPPA